MTTNAQPHDLHIERLPVDSLVPYDKNPRFNDEAVDSVANSINEFDWLVPIVANAKHIVLAGHTRLKAAKKMGMKEVPVIIADWLTPAQEKAFRLADNKVAEIATWDMGLLKSELDDLVNEGFDMGDFGFTDMDFGGETGEEEGDVDYEANGEDGTAADTAVPIFCTLAKDVEIGAGVCPHRCVYCYISTTKAGFNSKPAYPHTFSSIKNAVAENAGKIIVTGTTIDPSLFPKHLGVLLDACRDNGCPLAITTKNPRAVYDVLAGGHGDPRSVAVKISFSFLDEWRAKIAEPGAPSVAERIAAAKDLASIGVCPQLRLSPMFVGYNSDESIEQAIKDGCFTNLNCEPFTAKRPAMHYYEAMNDALDLDDHSVEGYFNRVGNGSYFGPMHEMDYDRETLRAEYERHNAIALKCGVGFGICGTEFKVQHMGVGITPGYRFGCDCAAFKHGACDDKALCYFTLENAIKAYLPRAYLDGEPTPIGTEEFETLVKRTRWTYEAYLDSLPENAPKEEKQ